MFKGFSLEKVISFQDHHSHFIAAKFDGYLFEKCGIGVVIGQGTDHIRVDLHLCDLIACKAGKGQHNNNDQPTEPYNKFSQFIHISLVCFNKKRHFFQRSDHIIFFKVHFFWNVYRFWCII